MNKSDKQETEYNYFMVVQLSPPPSFSHNTNNCLHIATRAQPPRLKGNSIAELYFLEMKENSHAALCKQNAEGKRNHLINVFWA